MVHIFRNSVPSHSLYSLPLTELGAFSQLTNGWVNEWVQVLWTVDVILTLYVIRTFGLNCFLAHSERIELKKWYKMRKVRTFISDETNDMEFHCFVRFASDFQSSDTQFNHRIITIMFGSRCSVFGFRVLSLRGNTPNQFGWCTYIVYICSM